MPQHTETKSPPSIIGAAGSLLVVIVVFSAISGWILGGESSGHRSNAKACAIFPPI